MKRAYALTYLAVPAFLGLVICDMHTVSGADPAPRMRNIVRKMLDDVPAVALEYTVILAQEGKERPVNPHEHMFVVGDQFRIRIEPKDDLYIYIFTEGPSGEKTCLQPTKEETAPFSKAGKAIELPQDGYFQFDPPAGEEKLIVVATSQPSKDLAALANVVFRKPDQLLTPKEKDERANLKSQSEKKLQSTEKEKLAGAKTRGVLSKEKVTTFAEDLKAKNRGTIEEPPHGEESSTFVMAVSKPGGVKPELFINIPLRSGPPKAGK